MISTPASWHIEDKWKMASQKLTNLAKVLKDNRDSWNPS